MLPSLRTRNLAIGKDLRVEFGPSLHVITGKTGAGKSLLRGAIQRLLGERSDKTPIRCGADQIARDDVLVTSRPRA